MKKDKVIDPTLFLLRCFVTLLDNRGNAGAAVASGCEGNILCGFSLQLKFAQFRNPKTCDFSKQAGAVDNSCSREILLD